MRKLAILKIGDGDFDSGFPVTLRIESDGACIPEIDGRLSPAPTIFEQYNEWRSAYNIIGLEFQRTIEIIEGQKTNISIAELAQELRAGLNQWLNELGREFQPIRDGLLYHLKPTDEIRFIIKTSDQLLLRLPWHLCDLFERYPNAEVTVSPPNQAVPSSSKKLKKQVRILVILGMNSDINVQGDLEILKEKLPDAYLFPLIATSRDKLDKQLWEQEWDIMFFAGHSCRDLMNGQGKFFINETESITIENLKYGLKNAIAKGLKLAIFNSCDGLGLAQDLADLQMPAIIVMRERIQDAAAQRFLEFFLEAFATKGKSLCASVREARERLYVLENLYPCASWLPVLCQHQNAEELTWMGLQETDKPISQGTLSFVKQLVYRNKIALAVSLPVGLIFSFSLTQLTVSFNNRKATEYTNRAVKYYQQGQPASAKLEIDKALTYKPSDGIILYTLGRICEEIGNSECTVNSYESAMKDSRTEAAAYNARARLYMKENQLDKALSLLQKAKSIVERDQKQQYNQQDKYAIYKNLAWVRLLQKRYPDALALLKAAIELEPKKAPAYCLYAELLEAQDGEQEALDLWRNCNRYADGRDLDEDRWIRKARQRLSK